MLVVALAVAACSAGSPVETATVPLAASATVSSATATVLPTQVQSSHAFPHCDGMQALTGPVKFAWPNLDDRMQDFVRPWWSYFSCDEPAGEISALYRQALPKPPYNMAETNWLERPEGTLGIYFSQTGEWDYIWIVPQPADPQKAYIIVAETFSYVEC